MQKKLILFVVIHLSVHKTYSCKEKPNEKSIEFTTKSVPIVAPRSQSPFTICTKKVLPAYDAKTAEVTSSRTPLISVLARIVSEYSVEIPKEKTKEPVGTYSIDDLSPKRYHYSHYFIPSCCQSNSCEY